MKLLEKRDFDTSPTQYAAFVQSQILWAKNILSMPAQNWPRGTSHEIAKALLLECETALENLALDFGQYFADGRLAGYSDKQ